MKFNPVPNPEPKDDTKKREIKMKIWRLERVMDQIKISRYDNVTDLLAQFGLMELASKIWNLSLKDTIRDLLKLPDYPTITHWSLNMSYMHVDFKKQGYLFDQETEQMGKDLAYVFAKHSEELADRLKSDIYYRRASDLYQCAGMEDKRQEMILKAEELERYYESNPRYEAERGSAHKKEESEDFPRFYAELLHLIEKYKDLPPINNQERTEFNEIFFKQTEKAIEELKNSSDRPV